jgi:hypothetical protein
MIRYPRAILMAVVSLAVLGCAAEKLPTLYPVAGTVTVDGKPLTSGHVSLTTSSTDQKIGLSTSEIGQDGSYVIYTSDKEGAPLGKYKVTVTPQTMMAAGTDPKAAPTASRVYSDPTKTPLTIDVVEHPGAGAYDLKLKKDLKVKR